MPQNEGSYINSLRKHWKRKRAGDTHKRNRSVNDCWKPSNEASKADLKEMHQEKMRLKSAHRRYRGQKA